MRKATMSKEEIFEVVESVIKQVSHNSPSPETIERLREINEKINDIESMLLAHSKDENSILKGIQESVDNVITDQTVKHREIEDQLKDIKPIRDGLTAANTIKKGILWISGFIAGVSLIIISIKQLSK